MLDPTDQLAGVLSAGDYATLSGYPCQGFRPILRLFKTRSVLRRAMDYVTFVSIFRNQPARIVPKLDSQNTPDFVGAI